MSEEIEQLLLTFGVHKGFPAKRAMVAHRISKTGRPFTKKVMVKLMSEAQSLGAKSPAAMVAGWLEDDSWTEVLLDSEVVEVDDPKAGRKETSNVGGILKHASRDNPYGWKDKEAALRQYRDNNAPGKWNPFRQSYNLTERQAREHGRKGNDFRRYRCSCFEIVGASENAADRKANIKRWESQPDWDPVEVERARGRHYADISDAPVYGEES